MTYDAPIRSGRSVDEWPNFRNPWPGWIVWLSIETSVRDVIMLVASALRRPMRFNVAISIAQPVENLVVALVTILETYIGAFCIVEEDGEHSHVLGASRRRAHSYAAGR
jgi:hypothetical protein